MCFILDTVALARRFPYFLHFVDFDGPWVLRTEKRSSGMYIRCHRVSESAQVIIEACQDRRQNWKTLHCSWNFDFSWDFPGTFQAVSRMQIVCHRASETTQEWLRSCFEGKEIHIGKLHIFYENQVFQEYQSKSRCWINTLSWGLEISTLVKHCIEAVYLQHVSQELWFERTGVQPHDWSDWFKRLNPFSMKRFHRVVQPSTISPLLMEPWDISLTSLPSMGEKTNPA